ncbi:MAG: hypothetical protein ACTSV7_10010 [Candidatus Baldrarchaeia archaeon]
MCKASEYVHVPFSKIDEESLSRNCVEDKYYYLNVVNTIKNRIKEIGGKIENEK